MIETTQNAKSALLVIPLLDGEGEASSKRRESELKALVDTLGMNVKCALSFSVKAISPAMYIGSGQAEEVRETATYYGVDAVIFDATLSPRAIRNLESFLDLCVIDRNEVILEIFSDNARTKEAVLQTELAKAEYELPRLNGRWGELSQQRGGVRGSKGEGEKKTEIEKRRLQERISKLKKELFEIKKRRGTQIGRRLRNEGLCSFALVGYTNAGKSSLMNTLTKSSVSVKESLFETLDTTSRRMSFGFAEAIVSDTVGFVSNLPHSLVNAFGSTLEEAARADVLIMVLDASSDRLEESLSVTEETLNGLGAGDKDRIMVLNKVDAIYDEVAVSRLKAACPGLLLASVKERKGIEEIKAEMEKRVLRHLNAESLTLSAKDSESIERCYKEHKVISAEYSGDSVTIKFVR